MRSLGDGDALDDDRLDRLVLAARADGGDLVVRITKADDPQKEYGEVAVARFSGGASFEFVDRGRSIPITPVGSSA